jgi:hypothetical protein
MLESKNKDLEYAMQPFIYIYAYFPRFISSTLLFILYMFENKKVKTKGAPLQKPLRYDPPKY